MITKANFPENFGIGHNISSLQTHVRPFVGPLVGLFVGSFVGLFVGPFVGPFVGFFVGLFVGPVQKFVGPMYIKVSCGFIFLTDRIWLLIRFIKGSTHISELTKSHFQ